MISLSKLILLGVWGPNPFAFFTISDILKLSKKKTKTWVFNSLKFFVERGILNLQRKSNLNIYSLNIANPLALQLLQYSEVQESIDFPNLGIISEIIEKSPIKNFSLIIFGSYAENKQTKQSDLDICLLIENREAEKKIRPYFNDIKLNHAINLDEHYITFSDFVEMLLRDEENVGKQIFRKHRLFYNTDIYYQLLKEAHKNGFRP